MNSSVVLFFLHTVLATFLLGGKFFGKRDPVVKSFGAALIFNGIAFAIWSAAVITKPADLESYVTIGVVFFMASLLAFLHAGTQHMGSSSRNMLLFGGAVLGAAVFYLRAFVYPSTPEFSAGGLFFFNPHPVIQMLYIFGLALTALPAIEALASKFTSGYAALVRYGFIAEVVGGVILITSTNSTSADSAALYMTGCIIGFVYFLLWTTLVLKSKGWRSN